MNRSLVLGGALAALVATSAVSQTLTLQGPAGPAREVTAAELASLPRQSVNLAREGGGTARYEGVALTGLLQSAGAPAGKALRGPELADLVVVTAKDGYRVVLALAETDPSIRRQSVILADRVDGAPLNDAEGPWRLIVEGDLRPARSARQVTSIVVRRVP